MGFRNIALYLRKSWRKSAKKTTAKEDEIQKPESALSTSTPSLSSSSSEHETIETGPTLLYPLKTKAEEQFNCQFRIPASDVKYSMVTTVTKSWDQDLKTIPNWDRIGGELLLRKYV